MEKEPHYSLNRRLGGHVELHVAAVSNAGKQTELIILVRMYRMYVHWCPAVNCHKHSATLPPILPIYE
jgi:hypothetical protein